MDPNNVMTASRMAALSLCLRKHYWAYEAMLKPATAADALAFGTAWHKAMEAMAKGADARTAFIAAAECGLKDEFTAATFQAMLAGYAKHWCTSYGTTMPEVQFSLPVKGAKDWTAEGKIDGIMDNGDGTVSLLEHKTAGQDIDPSSDYWLRLRGNVQIATYAEALSRNGYTVRDVVYDVARKPTIRPMASVPTLDASGLKTVIGLDGQRVYKRDGQPKQTADKENGEAVLSAPETAEQYGDRLYNDIMARPEYYFQRRVYTVSKAEIAGFVTARKEAVALVKHLRKRAKAVPAAWLRCDSPMVCKFCPYETLCLQDISPVRGVDEAPAGYRWAEEANEELAAASPVAE